MPPLPWPYCHHSRKAHFNDLFFLHPEGQDIGALRRFLKRLRHRATMGEGQGQHGGCGHFSLIHNHKATNDILQLPHITRPVKALDQAFGGSIKTGEGTAFFLGK